MRTASKFPLIAKRLTGGSHLGPRSLELQSERDRGLQPQSVHLQPSSSSSTGKSRETNPRSSGNHADHDHSRVTKH